MLVNNKNEWLLLFGMSTIYELCAERSKETGMIHLPNGNCEIIGTRRHHLRNEVLIVAFNQRPGFCNDEPTPTDRPLLDGVEQMEYSLQGRTSGPVRVPLSGKGRVVRPISGIDYLL